MATKSSKAKSPSQKKRGAAVADQGTGFLDSKTRRDIIAVIFAIVSIALFITVISPGTGIVTKFLNEWLRLLFGSGAFVLPFVLVAIGATFVIPTERVHISGRVSAGLVLLFLCILGLFGIFTPIANNETALYLFNETVVTERGGYIGAGIAWVGLTLFGNVVSIIILLGLIAIALLIIGFSLSNLLEKGKEVRDLRKGRKLDAEEQHDEKNDTKPVRVKGKKEQESLTERFGRMPAKADSPTRRVRRDEELLADAKTRQLGRDGSVDLGAAGAQTQVLSPADASAPSDSTASPSALTRKLGRNGSESKRSKPTKRKKADADASAAAGAVATAGRLATGHGSEYPSPTEDFFLPPVELLRTGGSNAAGKDSEAALADLGMTLQTTLADFGVDATVVGWSAGPTFTLFKVDLPAGVRVSKITNLSDDIALALATPGVRIFAPIPGTNYVGVEVPNKQRAAVLLGDVLPSAKKGPLQIALGKDVEGHNIVDDLAKMPHLLIGGTTGSGKSVSINGMIMSILMRSTPDECRLILIDPKRVEFTPYNGIPHLYVPVVTECKEAASALSWAVAEMERRLKILSKSGTREIKQYNSKVKNGLMDGENPAEQLPYIVIVIDELADLMMNVGKDVEFSISRLAQLARAAGIHLIVATQRPSTNVVTGLIKANITNRIALSVASSIDSRVILDGTGAEHLIGNGDMLQSKPELPRPQRLQGCYVSEDEIFAVVEHLKNQGTPDYHKEILQTNLVSIGDVAKGSNGSAANEDPLLWEAAEIVCSSGLGSTSNIQRRLKVGYSRAGRIMDMLEEKGIVGPANGSKPREVLVDELELESLKAFEAKDAAEAD